MIRSPIFGLSDRAVKLVNNNDVHFGGRSEGEGPCAACDEIETYCLEISFFFNYNYHCSFYIVYTSFPTAELVCLKFPLKNK